MQRCAGLAASVLSPDWHSSGCAGTKDSLGTATSTAAELAPSNPEAHTRTSSTVLGPAVKLVKDRVQVDYTRE